MDATPAQTAAAINALETARRILGHVAGIPATAVDRMFDLHRGYGHGNTRTGLIRYALALVAAQEAASDENLPTPVIPAVDVANLTVSHRTCTGRTGFGVAGGRLSGTRSEPLDPDSPRDIALWLLIPQWGMAGDGIFEHSNVFGQDPKALRGLPRANDGSKLDQLRVLEGIALLVTRGVSLEDACGLARHRGIQADQEAVRAELDSRRLGLWLQDRPWCQDAWRVLVGTDTDIPEDVRAAKAAMRAATNNGRRTRDILSVPGTLSVPEGTPGWERELLAGW